MEVDLAFFYHNYRLYQLNRATSYRQLVHPISKRLSLWFHVCVCSYVKAEWKRVKIKCVRVEIKCIVSGWREKQEKMENTFTQNV